MEIYLHLYSDETKTDVVRVLGPFDSYEAIYQAKQQLGREFKERGMEGAFHASEHRVDGVCDFCSDPKPPGYFKFPVENSVIGTVVMDGVTHVHMDTGEWAACETCRALISEGNSRGLVNRSVETLLSLAPGLPRSLARMSVAQSHAAFWRGYDGSDFILFPTVEDILGGNDA